MSNDGYTGKKIVEDWLIKHIEVQKRMNIGDDAIIEVVGFGWTVFSEKILSEKLFSD
jgi:hypothetical protein